MSEGIFPDMSFADYAALEAVNHTQMESFRQNGPRVLIEPVEREETKALQVGRLVHCLALTPSQFDQEFVVMPDFHLDPHNCTDKGKPSTAKTTSWYQTQVRVWHEDQQIAGRTVVGAGEKEEWQKIVDALLDRPFVSSLLGNENLYEVVLVAECPVTGLLLKARLDCWTRERQLVTDLKTQRPPIGRFEKDAGERGVHCQMAHYCRVTEILDGNPQNAALVVVEKPDKPSGSCLYRSQIGLLAESSEDGDRRSWTGTLEGGREENARTLEQMRICFDNDWYPVFPTPNECLKVGIVDPVFPTDFADGNEFFYLDARWRR